MIGATSRYQDAVKAFATSHIYDEFGRILLNGDTSTPVLMTATHEATYRLSIPNNYAPPPLEYPVREGETMQFLAWKTMRNHMNWWMMAEANPQVWYPLDITVGTTLRIPT